MACIKCDSYSVKIQTLNLRKSICKECGLRNGDSCSLDNGLIKKKAFSGICLANKFPKVKRKKSPPPLLIQLKSFVGSMKKWAKSGFSGVSNAEFNRRLEFCKSCEWWDGAAFANTGRCLKCGCSTKAKLRLKTEKCPIGKW